MCNFAGSVHEILLWNRSIREMIYTWNDLLSVKLIVKYQIFEESIDGQLKNKSYYYDSLYLDSSNVPVLDKLFVKYQIFEESIDGQLKNKSYYYDSLYLDRSSVPVLFKLIVLLLALSV